MLLQDWLCKFGNTPAKLTEDYAIAVKPHPLFPNLLFFKYNQIDSPMGEELVCESRGVILDSANDWAVVSRPFDKFFNYSEGHAKPIDWDSARVQEKLDGSLMAMYFYKGNWRVASNGTPDAGGPAGHFQGTFAELFMDTFMKMGYTTDKMDKAYTYIFELTSMYNRVVVIHDRATVTLIGVRHNATGQEMELYDQSIPNFPFATVKEFSLQTVDQIIATFATMSPVTQEGYVVVDKDFHRVKVKHPGYVAIHHAIDGAGPKKFLEIIRSGETSEVIPHFPEWKAEMDDIRAKYESVVNVLELIYKKNKDIASQKGFALAVTSACARLSVPTAPLFRLRAGKGSIRDFLREWDIQALMRCLGLKADK
jgi:T4 RnlA family RNA ligase